MKKTIIIILLLCGFLGSGNSYAQSLSTRLEVDQVMDSLILHLPLHSPKRFPKTQYTLYENFSITADSNDVKNNIPPFEEPDSIRHHVLRYLSDKDLFTTENMIQKTQMGTFRVYENILASKMVGFKNPTFNIILSMFTSFSFYDPLLPIGGTKYVSPISKRSRKKYVFTLLDSLNSEEETIYSISYRPCENTGYKGLEGVFEVGSKDWSLRNITATPYTEDSAVLVFNISQNYQYVDSLGWYPYQNNVHISLKNFSFDEYPIFTHLNGYGKSYITNLNVNPKVKLRKLGETGTAVSPDAAEKNSDFWEKSRPIELSRKQKNTYQYLDSLGETFHVEKRMTPLISIVEGIIPVSILDINLNKVGDFARYEGLRLGLGVTTNDKLSANYSLSAWAGYGLRDFVWKYGFGGTLNLNENKDLKLNLTHSYDGESNMEIYFPFAKKSYIINPSGFRHFLVEKADYTKKTRLSITAKPFNYMQAEIGFAQKIKSPSYAYEYVNPDFSQAHPGQYCFSEMNIGFRYAPYEHFLQLGQHRLVLTSRFPIVYFNYSKSFKDFLGGEFGFHKFDLRIDQVFHTRFFGKTKFSVYGGKIFGDAPFLELFDAGGSYSPFRISTNRSFQSMRINEFTSDRYVALYAEHDFGKLLFQTNSKFFAPQIILVTSLGWGDIKHPEYHQDIEIKSLEKGYYESGVIFNDLIKLGPIGCGLAVIFRYGPYQLPKFGENFSYKISLSMGF